MMNEDKDNIQSYLNKNVKILYNNEIKEGKITYIEKNVLFYDDVNTKKNCILKIKYIKSIFE